MFSLAQSRRYKDLSYLRNRLRLITIGPNNNEKFIRPAEIGTVKVFLQLTKILQFEHSKS